MTKAYVRRLSELCRLVEETCEFHFSAFSNVHESESTFSPLVNQCNWTHQWGKRVTKWLSHPPSSSCTSISNIPHNALHLTLRVLTPSGKLEGFTLGNQGFKILLTLRKSIQFPLQQPQLLHSPGPDSENRVPFAQIGKKHKQLTCLYPWIRWPNNSTCPVNTLILF